MTTRAHNRDEMCEGSAYCRAFGHAWVMPHPAAFEGKGRKRGYAVTLVCPRCGTEKHFSLSQRGELTAPRYIYPDGYLATFYIGSEERAEFRLEALGLPLPAPATKPVLRSVPNGERGSA